MTAIEPHPAAQPPPANTTAVGYQTPFGPTLALTVTLAAASFLLLMAVVLELAHPQVGGLGPFAGLVNQQNQTAKTFLYLSAFVVVLPLSLLAALRLVRAVNPPHSLPALSALLAGSLALVLVVLRLSGADSLGALLIAMAIWLLAAAAVLLRGTRANPWPFLAHLSSVKTPAAIAAGALVFACLLSVTHQAPSIVVLIIGAIAVVAVTWAARPNLRIPRLTRWPGSVVDLVLVVLLLLAVPNVVVFHASGHLPNIYLPPGIIQFQHDYILGPVNQLLGGGALLVNVPVSQYGVGMDYFLAGVFHIAPIGYGTFGLLDGVLTGLFYVAGYCVLRITGMGRLLAGATLSAGVVVLIYNLYYAIGALPEQGPLRFGLPMALILTALAAHRWPGRSRGLQALELCVLGVAAVWALEAFAYTAFTFIALALARAWLGPEGDRVSKLLRRLGAGLLACLAAHVIFALLTLAGSGHLPDWGQYLAYGRALLLGGRAGAISYGFATWSPGLAFGAGVLACAAAVVLLVLLKPAAARREPLSLLGLVGCTAYSIAALSYTDNRSSTYLIAYVALPLLMAGALWLRLVLRAGSELSRRGVLAFALSLVVLLVAVAWPRAGSRFSDSALAHAYPSGGLTATIHRLWHPPPIDPRAPRGQALLARFIPAKRQLILLPTVPDLGTEILMRSRRANSMFIGDPKADGLVPSVWEAKLGRSVAALRSGQRVLTDDKALAMLPALRRISTTRILNHPLSGGTGEIEWLLRAIDARFTFRPIYRDRDGLIVAELTSRR